MKKLEHSTLNVIEMEINIFFLNFSMYKNVPNVMIPAFWFAQTVELDEKLARDAKVDNKLRSKLSEKLMPN